MVGSLSVCCLLTGLMQVHEGRVQRGGVLEHAKEPGGQRSGTHRAERRDLLPAVQTNQREHPPRTKRKSLDSIEPLLSVVQSQQDPQKGMGKTFEHDIV